MVILLDFALLTSRLNINTSPPPFLLISRAVLHSSHATFPSFSHTSVHVHPSVDQTEHPRMTLFGDTELNRAVLSPLVRLHTNIFLFYDHKSHLQVASTLHHRPTTVALTVMGYNSTITFTLDTICPWYETTLHDPRQQQPNPH